MTAETDVEPGRREPVRWSVWQHRGRPFAWRRLLLLAYPAALAFVVLTPISAQLNWLCVAMYVVWTDTLGLPGGLLPEDFGFALNVLLFVPLGLALVLRFRRSWSEAMSLAFAVSLTIELVQALPGVDRYPSLADVISNTLGGLAGALLALAYRRTSPRQGSAVQTTR